MNHNRYLLGITGASGAAYGLKTAKAILEAGGELRLILTHMGAQVLEYETGVSMETIEKELPGAVIEENHNLFSPLASGSYPWRAMAVVPCSMSTLGRIAGGITTDLLTRAAEVSLKQRRPLVLVPRETPLTTIHLKNMLTLAECGAQILPAMPGFYGHPRTVDDLVSFLTGKILDAMGIQNLLSPTWEGQPSFSKKQKGEDL